MKKIIATMGISLMLPLFVLASDAKNDVPVKKEANEKMITFTTNAKEGSIAEKIIKFQSGLLAQEDSIILKSMNIVDTGPLPESKEFKYYVIETTLIEKKTNKENSGKFVWVSNGKYISKEVYNLDELKMFGEDKVSNTNGVKKLRKVQLGDEDYLESHLVIGKHNAKNKVAIFTDPMCSACINRLPPMLDIFRTISRVNDIGVYVYTLASFQYSDIVAAYLTYLKQKGIKNVDSQYYEINLLSKLKSKVVKDEKIKIFDIIDILNDEYKQDIGAADILKKDVIAHVQKSIELANKHKVNATPSIFINGVFDHDMTLVRKLVTGTD